MFSPPSLGGPKGVLNRPGLLTSPTATTPRLPLPDLNAALRLCIEDALREAWRRLTTNSPAPCNPRTASETKVTEELVKILNELRDDTSQPVPGFTGSIFQNVIRGEETTSFDGRHPEKRPDMTFRPVHLQPGVSSSQLHALLAECKHLSDESRSLSRYFCEGLRRFLVGEYAWAMPSALMVAYHRGTISAAVRMQKFLTRGKKTGKGIAGSPAKFACVALPNVRPGSPSTPPLVLTRHQRTWTYAGGSSPGDIEIGHLWLPVP